MEDQLKFRLVAGRKQWVAELKKLAAAAEAKAHIPILRNVDINVAPGSALFTTTNLDVYLHRSPALEEFDGEGRTTVNAKDLLAAVSAIGKVGPNDDVAVSLMQPLVEGDPYVVVSSGNGTQQLETRPWEDMPAALPTGKDVIEFDFNVGNFREAWAHVKHGISHEDSRFQLAAALIEPDDGGLRVTTTDGHRLASIRFAGRVAKGGDGRTEDFYRITTLLPGDLIENLLRNFEDDQRLCVKFKEFSIVMGVRNKVQLQSRRVEGSFPDWRRVVQRGTKDHVEVDAQAIVSACEAALKAKVNQGQVKLDVTVGEISASVPVQVKSKVEVRDPKLSGAGIVGLNAKYLLEAAAACGTKWVRILLTDEKTQVQFEPIFETAPPLHDPRQHHVLMPCSL